MNKRDFYFELPSELIAQYPLKERREARLLSYSKQSHARQHFHFSDLPELLQDGDLLVMNDTKVIPARLHGKKESGGKVELLIERMYADHYFLAQIRASKALKPGSWLYLERNWRVQVIEKREAFFLCKAEGDPRAMLAEIGHIPLPPYIQRADENFDETRYQTVYAQHEGSVAAPTAGLHFDEILLEQLKQKGVELGFTTLHVGAGTFKPLRVEEIKAHQMHQEYFMIQEKLCEQVNSAKAAKRRVIAVGTTSLRSLESAARDGILYPFEGETGLFISPGYQFQICDGLITNFHLPESSLLILVAAFIGHAEAMALYEEAVKSGYRFFSYGDASFLV